MGKLMLVPGNMPAPAIGIGYRSAIDTWTSQHLASFDVIEVTIDHCIQGDNITRAKIFGLIDRVPLTAHGIGLSIGTDVPLDLQYLDEVAVIVDRLKSPIYSEHLAFTRVPGRELGNLLPLPQTEAIAEAIIEKVKVIQARVGVPFLLENISYLFTWPDSRLTDAEFINLICRETGANLLLDLENLSLNARNHGFDPYEFLNALPSGLVKEIHLAGGELVPDPLLPKPFFADSHAHPVRDDVFCLLAYVLETQAPSTIVLERDDRLEAVEEILSDIAKIRTQVALKHARESNVINAA